MGERERGVRSLRYPPCFALTAAPMRSSLALSLLLVLTGCFPSSNQRKLARDLFPSDSLSRAIAEAVPVDTLALVRRVEAPPEAALEYPTSLVRLGDGRLVVAETRRGALVTFDSVGAFRSALASEAFSYPFLAGVVGDTVAVLNRGAHRVDLVVGDAVVGSVAVPEARNGAALFTGREVLYKTAEEGAGSALYRLDLGGAERARYALRGPYWRHLGFLRAWGDSLLALSGYRPVVDVLAPYTPAGAVLDTLALVGFDSPQLARSRLWARGEVDEPPLLSPSAAPLGERLFVLNARPGWVHIDVFERGEGGLRLRRTLIQPDPEMDDRLLPIDLVVRRVGEAVEFVVLTARPKPGLTFYRWTPEPGAAPEAAGDQPPSDSDPASASSTNR
jgi:hypothetical protein